MKTGDLHVRPSQVPWMQTPTGMYLHSRGFGWVLAGLLLLFAVATRKLLFTWGVPVPMRLISQVGGVTAFGLLVVGMWQFNRHHATQVRPDHLARVRIWQGLLIILFIFGALRGNSLTVIGKEAIVLWFFSAVWIAGANDRFWYALEKPLTVLFYIAVPLVFLYADTPAPITRAWGTATSDLDTVNARALGTLAYEFRPLIGMGMFLGIWGMVRTGSKWRLLQIGAFFLTFAIQVGLFKFRSTAVFFGMAGISVLVLRPLLEYRRRPGLTALLLAAGCLGAIVFFNTEASRVLLERFANPEPLFGSRWRELSTYFSAMGSEIFIGRGLGGTYEAYQVFGTESSANWRTLHFGLMIFNLKGGLLMLALFVSMLATGLIVRSKMWYQNPCNLTAALILPVLIARFCLVPFGLAPENILTYLPIMMVLARFGRPKALDVPAQPPEVPPRPEA
jgi:hypothetical protein